MTTPAVGLEPKVNTVPVFARIFGKGTALILEEDNEWYLVQADGTKTSLAQAGSDGDDGWSPILAVVEDGTRRVIQLVEWTGGTGTEPAGAGKYLGPLGLVTAIEDATDFRGATGATGTPGTNGTNGTNGTDGEDGWSPLLAVATDSARRVLQITDYTGGSGTEPSVGYLGATGIEALIANGVDIRGAAGAAGANGDTGWSPEFAVVIDGARRVLQLVDWEGGTGSDPGHINEYLGAAGFTSVIGDAIDIRGATGASGAGTGDVNGPGTTVTSGKLVVWDGTGGDAIREIAGGDASAARTDLGAAAASHTHAQSDITDLTTDLAAKQPLDTDLTAIAALTSAADKAPYATGAGTWALYDLTSYGRGLVAVANEAAFKALVNLEAGVDYQAFDAELTAIAGLVSAADRGIYFTGSGTASLFTLTSFARSILDDSDASTVRSTIGAAATSHTHVMADITDLAAALALKAPLANPTFTGSVIVPNQTALDNSTKAANTGYVDSAVAALSTVYQPLDATLTGLAAVSTAADKGIYATGSNVFSTFDLSTFARTLLDDTSAAAMLATLGAAGQGLQTIYVPANAMVKRTTLPPADYSLETATNKVMVVGLAFDAAADEFAQFDVEMPKSWDKSTVTAAFHWSAPSGTGNVVWALQGVAISDDDVLDAAFGTAQTVTDGLTATTDNMRSAATGAITIAGTPAVADRVIFQVYRDADNGSDTFSADAVLLGVTLFYTTNAATDA